MKQMGLPTQPEVPDSDDGRAGHRAGDNAVAAGVSNISAGLIQAEALRLGYEQCGIIRLHELDDYKERLVERMTRFPASRTMYERLFRFDGLAVRYSWAKSVVVCAMRYGRYHIPAHLAGHIAKYYLVDGRTDRRSAEYQASEQFESCLVDCGLKVQTERQFGLVPLRWAAMKAGLGIVRKNNFFYTGHGSWVHLEAWLIDRELELKHECRLQACPEHCSLCRKACPTGSLCAPYTMDWKSCVSCITTWTGRDLPHDPLRQKLGQWFYGCDACQDVCPFNRGQWTEEAEFPGLAELAERLTPDGILAMEDEFLRREMQPKFWYLAPEEVWKWKVNVLNAILNRGDGSFRESVQAACRDRHPKVREMAEWVMASANFNGSAPSIFFPLTD